MILFWLIFLILAILTLFESLNKKIIPGVVAVSVFLMLSVFAALRPPEAVADYQVYLFFFQLFGKPSEYFTDYISWVSFEPFYYLIPSVLHYTFQFESYANVTIWIYAILGTGVVMLSLYKLTDFFYAAVLTLYCNYFLLQQLTQIREAVAVGLLLLMVYFKCKGKIRSCLLCGILAFLFHYSVILSVVIIFLASNKLNKKLYGLLALSSFLLSFLNFNFISAIFNVSVTGFDSKQDFYVENVLNETLNKRSFFFLSAFANTLFIIYFADRIFKQNKFIYLLVKLQVVGLLTFQLFSASPILGARISQYYLATHLVCFPAILYLFKSRFWPTLCFCFFNGIILFYFIHINKLVDVSHYGF
jgi:hypothetical protein